MIGATLLSAGAVLRDPIERTVFGDKVRSEVVTEYNNVESKDLHRVDIKNVSVQQAETGVNILFDAKVGPGDKANAKWFRQGGDAQAGVEAEILWNSEVYLHTGLEEYSGKIDQLDKASIKSGIDSNTNTIQALGADGKDNVGQYRVVIPEELLLKHANPKIVVEQSSRLSFINTNDERLYDEVERGKTTGTSRTATITLEKQDDGTYKINSVTSS